MAKAGSGHLSSACVAAPKSSSYQRRHPESQTILALPSRFVLFVFGMSQELWTSPVTGYRRKGTRLAELRSLIDAAVTARAILEPLQSCCADTLAVTAADLLRRRDYDFAGVKRRAVGPVIGWGGGKFTFTGSRRGPPQARYHRPADFGCGSACHSARDAKRANSHLCSGRLSGGRYRDQSGPQQTAGSRLFVQPYFVVRNASWILGPRRIPGRCLAEKAEKEAFGGCR